MTAISSKRLTETWLGRAAAALLLLIWVGSMSSTDSNGYSYFPVLVGLGAVVLLTIAALLMGAKAVRLPWLAWGSLGVGVYFLVRAFLSPSMPEAWVEISIILACMVFYVAGVYAAQGRRAWPLLAALSVALVLNIAFWWLMKQPWAPIEWTGRPAVGPCSENTRPITMMFYKNWAGAFLFIAGTVLAAAVLWLVKGQKWLLILLPLPVFCIWLSGECGTRAFYLLAPVALSVIIAMTVLQRLFADEKLGGAVILSAIALMVAFVIGVYALLFDRSVQAVISEIDTHSRYENWKYVMQLLPDVPLWGNGVGAVRHYYQSLATLGNVNYAHNEYLEIWAAYGLIGIGCALAVITLHIGNGCCALASASVTPLRRVQVSLAVLTLLLWVSCAVCDYMWHQIAQTAMTAFTCGMLASPYPYEDKYGRRHSVSVESCWGKSLLVLLMLGGLGIGAQGVMSLKDLWLGQWEYNALSTPGRDSNGKERCALLKAWFERYPAPELADRHLMLATQDDDYPVKKQMLMRVLQDTPGRLYTVAQLGKLMTDHGEYEEAEALFRSSYPGDGPATVPWFSYAAFYAYNVLQRGLDCMRKGAFSSARSLLEYGLTIKSDGFYYRVNQEYSQFFDQKGTRKAWNMLISACKADLKLLEMQGIEPDDSWMEPMELGGKPSLYRRWALPNSPEAKAAKK